MRVAQTTIVALLLTFHASAAEPWSRFRGPNGTGVAAGEGYPIQLDPDTNAIWKTPVRPGKSSPVLTDDAVFLTAFDEGKLFSQCFDRKTGRLLWEHAIERRREALLTEFNEPAAHTPATDGASVYVMFRDVGLLSYDATGQLRWLTELGPFEGMRGHTASPVLADGKVVVQADQIAGSYIAAFNTANGEMEWRTPRVEGEGWATPAVHDGSYIVTTNYGWLGAHSVEDGKRLWGVQSLSPRIIASPVVMDGRVYTFGYGVESLTDFLRGFEASDQDADGRLTEQEYGANEVQASVANYSGDRDGILTRDEYLTFLQPYVSPTRLVAFELSEDGPAKELWSYERSFTQVIPSPLVYQGILYFVRNGGIVESLDAETGEVLKRGRLREAIAGYSASPIAADGKVYLASEEGQISTLAAGREWEVLATSDLDAEIYATPALSDGAVFVRTQDTLYCFREPK